MKEFPVKVGFIPISKFIFNYEESLKYKQRIESKLREWKIDYVSIDKLVKDGMIHRMQDIEPVVEYLKGQKVDAVFCPHCNFGTEGLVGLIGRKMGVPFLLWGPQDDPPLANGARTRDTLCGLFASSKVLNKLEVPFNYIENCPVDDPCLQQGFRRFLRVASMVKSFRNIRIGKIGPRVNFFYTTIVNESDLFNRYGVEIVTRDLIDLASSAKKRAEKDRERYEKEAEEFKRGVDLEGFHNVREIAVLFALRDELLQYIETEALSGIAIQNIQSLVYELGVDQAYVYSYLNGCGIPVGTETDIHGVISSIVLQGAAMGDSPTFLSDVTIRHPEDPNGFLLWHTSWPLSIADPGVRPKLGTHWLWRSEYPGMSHWKAREGELSLLRFEEGGGEYRIGTGEVETIPGPFTQNNYVWVRAKNWKRWERKLIEGPYMHHISCAYGRYAEVVAEAIRYLPGVGLELFDGE